MRPGLLRNKITIRSEQTTQDAAGQPIPDWTADAGVVARDVPAAFKSVGGGEQVRGVQVQAGESELWTIRYPSYSVTPQMRVYYSDVARNITRAVDALGTRVWLDLYCSRVP